jgi:signal transduction histidine kinase
MTVMTTVDEPAGSKAEITSIVHDLRNPLSAIHGSVQMLVNSRDKRLDMLVETIRPFPAEQVRALYPPFEPAPGPPPEPPAGIHLTRLESALLRRLWENPGKCLSRQFLLRNIWGYQEGVRSRTLDVHIRRLRAKLGPAGRTHIKTFFGDGYCWYPER